MTVRRGRKLRFRQVQARWAPAIFSDGSVPALFAIVFVLHRDAHSNPATRCACAQVNSE